jgi:Na+(H+)/acetate symporter ActP
MSLISDIVAAYRAPRREMRRHIDNVIGEEQTLFFAMLFGGMSFIAQLPDMAKRAHLTDHNLSDLAAAQLIASVFMMPLLMYGIAAISHVIVARFGGQGDHIGARRALFWAAVVTVPVLLLSALVNTFAPDFRIIGAVITSAVFFWQWFSNLRELEFGNV